MRFAVGVKSLFVEGLDSMHVGVHSGDMNSYEGPATNPSNPNEDGLTFTAWQHKVDAVLVSLCGLTSSDLADYPSYDLWNDSVSPFEAAVVCLEEWNDFPADLLPGA